MVERRGEGEGEGDRGRREREGEGGGREVGGDRGRQGEGKGERGKQLQHSREKCQQIISLEGVSYILVGPIQLSSVYIITNYNGVHVHIYICVHNLYTDCTVIAPLTMYIYYIVCIYMYVYMYSQLWSI